MSAVIHPPSGDTATAWPLLAGDDMTRTVAWRDGRPVTAAAFLADVARVAACLPARAHAINLCEDRYAFTVAFCAVASRGQTTLLPPSRAPRAVDEALAAYASTYVLSDTALDPAPDPLVMLPVLAGVTDEPVAVPRIAASQVVAIGFTSGSTGQPKPNTKTWDNFRRGTLCNLEVLAATLGIAAETPAHVVATVPPQHMYGMETSVLPPLFGAFAVHAARPFFPADIASALASIPSPRILVTTPVHLRALLRDDVVFPSIDAIVSATAPLPADLAREAEARLGAPMLEVFGSTETCVIAWRRTALENAWTLHDDVDLRPQPDGTLVSAAHLDAPVLLQDIVELLPGRRFELRGRNADLLEIAGKRASLADLTRRLLEIPGVVDAIVFQAEEVDASGVQRIAALVVAPTLSDADVLAAMRRMIDPVFLPRPLRRVAALPRNETGKLPRAALLAILRSTG